ncbi:hypothetical protein CDL12_07042 [Handroanthus impetiginosus]|uniref:Transmembrane protein n=1 Tax=Handroanthus impetiginosus TaxID=429701 RepID=A0A2G9HRX9_9LAMI|nr:hypothetical protein CDL12_07042 [Handroanthus impetiginosus]
MDYYCNRKIFIIYIFLFILLSVIISFACPTPSLDQNLKTPSELIHTSQMKKTPVFLNGNGKGLYRRSSRMKRKKTKNLSNTRPFYAMLPKGYVPPSGSSPCHNAYPNSVAFFCGFSGQRYQP